LANFLDEFYVNPSAAAIAGTPDSLAPKRGELGCVQDSDLAATAEELARIHALDIPA
jgi:hypothetical protein